MHLLWKWVVKAAVAIAQTKWARDKAKQVISQIRASSEARVKAIADAAGVAVPKHDLNAFRAATIVRTQTDCLKPGHVVFVEGDTYQITKLLSVSSSGATYEAKLL
jgi:ATP-dependent 26S proteasome regulatory subunit